MKNPRRPDSTDDEEDVPISRAPIPREAFRVQRATSYAIAIPAVQGESPEPSASSKGYDKEPEEPQVKSEEKAERPESDQPKVAPDSTAERPDETVGTRESKEERVCAPQEGSMLSGAHAYSFPQE